MGIYTESEASDVTLSKGKENKGYENREREGKTGKIVGGGPETHNYYCAYDGQGNITQVNNRAGDKPYNIYTYDSYGTQTGSDYSNDSFSSYKGYDKGPFGYKTGVRQYDPETGRFLSPDAFKGYMTDPPSQHPYMYCHGNPVKFSDPSGYEPGRDYLMGKTSGIFGNNPQPVDPAAVIGTLYIAGGIVLCTVDGLLPAGDVVGVPMIAKGSYLVMSKASVISSSGAATMVGAGSIAFGTMMMNSASNNYDEGFGKRSYRGGGKKTPKFKSTDALRKHNKEFRDVAKKLNLNKDQQRLLHDQVTKRHFTREELLDIAKGLFGIK